MVFRLPLVALLLSMLLAAPVGRTQAAASATVDDVTRVCIGSAPDLAAAGTGACRSVRDPDDSMPPLLAGIAALWFVRRRRARTPLGVAANAAAPVILLAGAMLLGMAPPTLA